MGQELNKMDHIMVTFENSDCFNIDAGSLGVFQANGISRSIMKTTAGGVREIQTAESVIMKVNPSEAGSNYMPFGGAAGYCKAESKFGRITGQPDIVSVTVFYADGASETIYVDYDDHDGNGMETQRNANQQSAVSSAGSLYLVISAKESLDDCFQMDIELENEQCSVSCACGDDDGPLPEMYHFVWLEYKQAHRKKIAVRVYQETPKGWGWVVLCGDDPGEYDGWHYATEQDTEGIDLHAHLSFLFAEYPVVGMTCINLGACRDAMDGLKHAEKDGGIMGGSGGSRTDQDEVADAIYEAIKDAEAGRCAHQEAEAGGSPEEEAGKEDCCQEGGAAEDDAIESIKKTGRLLGGLAKKEADRAMGLLKSIGTAISETENGCAGQPGRGKERPSSDEELDQRIQHVQKKMDARKAAYGAMEKVSGMAEEGAKTMQDAAQAVMRSGEVQKAKDTVHNAGGIAKAAAQKAIAKHIENCSSLKRKLEDDSSEEGQ